MAHEKVPRVLTSVSVAVSLSSLLVVAVECHPLDQLHQWPAEGQKCERESVFSIALTTGLVGEDAK